MLRIGEAPSARWKSLFKTDNDILYRAIIHRTIHTVHDTAYTALRPTVYDFKTLYNNTGVPRNLVTPAFSTDLCTGRRPKDDAIINIGGSLLSFIERT